MAIPFNEKQLQDLPMSGGCLEVCFEDPNDVAQQMRDFIPNQGLFVKTKLSPRPFSEFSLNLSLPSGEWLPPMPGRLIQVVAHGQKPGLMLQLLRLPKEVTIALETYLKQQDQSEIDCPDDQGRLVDQNESSACADQNDLQGPDEPGSNNADAAMNQTESEQAFREKNKAELNQFFGESRVAILQRLRKMTTNERARLAKRANRTIRSILMRDKEALIIHYLLQNPQISRAEVVDITKLTTLNYQVVAAILANKQWSNGEDIRYNLVCNPRTPLPNALKLVSLLNLKHLRTLAKDWSMKSQIKQLALRLVVQREGT